MARDERPLRNLAKPLSSVHAASSDGAHEAQQRDEPIGVVTPASAR